MSVFVTSDLHGMTLEEFRRILAVINFKQEDSLYILGDVIDRRNDGGIALLEWITKQSNIHMLLGNHEDMLLLCEFALGSMTEEEIDRVSRDQISLLSDYIYNGGEPTVTALNALGEETTRRILEYLKALPLYYELELNGRSYVLVHSAPDNFDPHRPLCDYTKTELIWNRPDIDDEFYEDRTLIVGHTPTLYYGNEFKGRIMHRPTWIDIDTGAVYGNKAAVIRLDDMREFYY